jgi:predicted Fe-Mo cluster-binding NifX family protein
LVLILTQCCTMNIAIPILNESVAPCFEAAKTFKIFKTRGLAVFSTKLLVCNVDKGITFIKLVEIHDIDVLICNGIKNYLKDQLNSIGIKVISDVNDTPEKVVNLFLSGEIKENNRISICLADYNAVLHEDLVRWAKNLFEGNGFEVTSLKGNDSVLIDLVAKFTCPVCHKPIKVGVCCGAQTYRADQEIREFFYSANSRYDVCAYVYIDDPIVKEYCSKYGIEYLCTENIEYRTAKSDWPVIPILKNPIAGHENLFKKTHQTNKKNMNTNPN